PARRVAASRWSTCARSPRSTSTPWSPRSRARAGWSSCTRPRPSWASAPRSPPPSPRGASTRSRRRCSAWVASTPRTRWPTSTRSTCRTWTACSTPSTPRSRTEAKKPPAHMPSYVPFKLPDVGEGLTEADIVEWKVAPGDEVVVNQTIVEIETAKSLVELPSPYAGVVHELLAEPGATVDVGTPIIVIDTDPGGEAAAPGDEPESETSGDVLVGYGTKAPSSQRRRRRGAPAGAHAADAPQPAEPAPAGAHAADAPQPAEPAPAQQPAPAPEPRPAPVASTPATPATSNSSAVLAKPPVRKLAKDLG